MKKRIKTTKTAEAKPKGKKVIAKSGLYICSSFIEQDEDWSNFQLGLTYSLDEKDALQLESAVH